MRTSSPSFRSCDQAVGEQKVERRGVRAEGDLVPVAAEEVGEGVARVGQQVVGLDRAREEAVGVGVVIDEVVGHGVDHALRHLCAARAVEVGDGMTVDRALQGGKLPPHIGDIELHGVAAPRALAGRPGRAPDPRRTSRRRAIGSAAAASLPSRHRRWGASPARTRRGRDRRRRGLPRPRRRVERDRVAAGRVAGRQWASGRRTRKRAPAPGAVRARPCRRGPRRWRPRSRGPGRPCPRRGRATLGPVEGLEGARGHVARHADAVVAHFEQGQAVASCR